MSKTTWALRLGMLSVLLLPVSVIGVRMGLWPFLIGFLVIACAALLGAITVIWVLLCIFRPALASQRTHLSVAALLGISPILLVTVLIGGAASKPKIHDISTDWQQPLMFDVLLQQRGSDANSLQPDSEVIALAQLHYPFIKPINSSLNADQAKQRVITVAQALNWEIIAANKAGLIEATYTSAMFGFVDDIAIRIAPNTEGGSRIDIRSVSRVGQSDLGANAARIAEFTQLYLASESK